MDTTVEQIVNKISSEIRSHLETAVGEMAHDMMKLGSGYLDDKWIKKIKAAKKRGVTDIEGWLGDALFNDAGTLQDLMGDRIYDLCKGNRLIYGQVLERLSINSFPALGEACRELDKRNRDAISQR